MREEYPLTYMCNVFYIHRQAFYKWERKGKPIANNFNIGDANLISEEHHRLKRKYGVERLKEEIKQQGRMVLYFWNDVNKDGICLPAYQKQVFKQLGMQSR